MDRRQLEYFVAVADHGGFTSAAQTLFIAQPSLSQAIKNLEAELGVVLFRRVRSGVTLTSAGEALLSPARRALRDFEAAEAAVVNVRHLERGRLDIAASPFLAADPLAPYVGRFSATYPGVLVRIADPGMSDAVDLLRNGDSEVALTIEPTETSDLITVSLPPDPLWVLVPPGWDHRSGEPIHVEELSTLPLVTTATGRAMLTRLLDRAGVQPRFRAESGHREAVVPLVLEGVGAAIMSQDTARRAEKLGAVARPITPALDRRMRFAYRPTALSPAASAFVDMLTPPRAAAVPLTGVTPRALTDRPSGPSHPVRA